MASEGEGSFRDENACHNEGQNTSPSGEYNCAICISGHTVRETCGNQHANRMPDGNGNPVHKINQQSQDNGNIEQNRRDALKGCPTFDGVPNEQGNGNELQELAVVFVKGVPHSPSITRVLTFYLGYTVVL